MCVYVLEWMRGLIVWGKVDAPFEGTEDEVAVAEKVVEEEEVEDVAEKVVEEEEEEDVAEKVVEEEEVEDVAEEATEMVVAA